MKQSRALPQCWICQALEQVSKINSNNQIVLGKVNSGLAYVMDGKVLAAGPW